MKRRDRAREAVQLRKQGLIYREIAERMGISRSYASLLCTDPTGDADRRRKASYGGICRLCGAATTGCNGPDAAPDLCNHCAPSEAEWAWGRDGVIEAMLEWRARYGRLPAAQDWQITYLRDCARPGGDRWGKIKPERAVELLHRHEHEGPWPATHTVQYQFGSWSVAIAAAAAR